MKLLYLFLKRDWHDTVKCLEEQHSQKPRGKKPLTGIALFFHVYDYYYCFFHFLICRLYSAGRIPLDTMNYQVTLDQLAAERGLTLTPLSELSRFGTPRKISCCGGWVLYTYAESAVDSSVVLRDASGSIVCAFHQSMLSLHPDALTTHALVLLQDVSFIPSINRKFPSFLAADISNLIALMLPEEDDESAQAEHSGVSSHADAVSTSVIEHGSDSLAEDDALKEGDPDCVSSYCCGSPSQQQGETQELASTSQQQGQQQYSLHYGLDRPQKKSLTEQGYDSVFPVEAGHQNKVGECCGTFPHFELEYESQKSENEVNNGFSSKVREISGPLLSSSSSFSLPARGLTQSFPSSLNKDETPPSMIGAVSNSIPNPVTPLSDTVAARIEDHLEISSGLREGMAGREYSSPQMEISQVDGNERPIHGVEEVVREGDDLDKINGTVEEETDEEQEEEDAINCLEFAD